MELIICSRKSKLAMVQAEFVADLIMKKQPNYIVSIIGISTKGDEILDKSLSKIGGKGLFVKELEQCLLSGKAHLAVHSMKDLPYELPSGLTIASILKRENPQDVLISRNNISFINLPKNSIVGTSSLRRQVQLQKIRSDLQYKPIRGNVGTRLDKLESGEFDALILAAAGLNRLGLSHKITEYFDEESVIPAVGQGALALECVNDNIDLIKNLQSLQDNETKICTLAERAFNAKLNGSCELPIAVHAILDKGEIKISSMVSKINGSNMLFEKIQGPVEQYKELGEELASIVLSKGGRDIIQDIIR